MKRLLDHELKFIDGLCFATAAAIVVSIVVHLALTLQAQVPPMPDSWTVIVIPSTGDPATVAPVATRVVTLAQAVCNLPASTTTPKMETNPQFVQIDDPRVTGRTCRLPLPTGLPNTVPGSEYRVVTSATTAGVTGPRSTVAPFPFAVVPVTPAPAAPTGLVVLQ